MTLWFLLAACSDKGGDSSGAQTFPAPTVAWLTPKDGGAVTQGDVACSIVVDNYVLVDPAKHSEGEPSGYVEITVDGKKAMDTKNTTFTLPLAAGAHDLKAQLFYADGDAVDATPDRVCSEDDTDTACAPVSASISVTAKLGA